ncbi:hypothetical protein [Nostoc sp.]
MTHEPTLADSSGSLSNRELEQYFPGDSELANRMRALDWSQTDLGSPRKWPENLRVAVAASY